MFKNLIAEQARNGYTDEYIAKQLDIARATYSAKKSNGNFTLPEIRILIRLFDKPFDYLFESDNKPA